MARTKIDWADETINPITGCRNFGRPDICGNYCYAARIARRWAIIGAESHNRVGRIIPQPAWIAVLVSRIPRPIPVFMKENLRPHIPADWDLVQQFPEGLQ